MKNPRGGCNIGLDITDQLSSVHYTALYPMTVCPNIAFHSSISRFHMANNNYTRTRYPYATASECVNVRVVETLCHSFPY